MPGAVGRIALVGKTPGQTVNVDIDLGFEYRVQSLQYVLALVSGRYQIGVIDKPGAKGLGLGIFKLPVQERFSRVCHAGNQLSVIKTVARPLEKPLQNNNGIFAACLINNPDHSGNTVLNRGDIEPQVYLLIHIREHTLRFHQTGLNRFRHLLIIY